jgi:tetratricopeptide (TPR) repeat protein
MTRKRDRQKQKQSPPPDQSHQGQAMFGEALRHHQSGSWKEAERLYREVLAQESTHIDALHLLGVLAHQTGRNDLALILIGKAIAQNGQVPALHNNLGIVLKAHGKVNEAVASYERALTYQPDFAEAYFNLGNALKAQGKFDKAAVSFGRALTRRPDYAEAHNNLGLVLQEQKNLAAAEASYRRALILLPNFAEAHSNRGITLKARGKPEEAEACYRRALTLTPNYAEAHNNLGLVLLEQDKPEEALASFGKAAALKPDYAEAHGDLGLALKTLGRLDEAVTSFRRALALKPDLAETHSNLGNIFQEQGKVDEAVTSFRRALTKKPDYAEVHNNLAMSLLAWGEMAEGWQEYEWRWHAESLRMAPRNFVQPQWRGESAEGKTLLIHAEQGLGDSVQFCRYASLAAARGLRVTLEAPPPLVRLLQSLSGVDLVVESGKPLPPFDLHCPMLSLPLALNTTLTTIPQAASYLRADGPQSATWQRRLAAWPGHRIGLAWAGNARIHSSPQLAAVDRRRSIAPDRLLPLTELAGVTFFSLQKEGPKAPDGLKLTDFMEEMRDFADTAALIANLDLVISVDTAVAHLAAALGKPVWLLDRYDPCWRWLRNREDSPWYPSLRLFRQTRAGDWQAVIERVRTELSRTILRNEDEAR